MGKNEGLERTQWGGQDGYFAFWTNSQEGKTENLERGGLLMGIEKIILLDGG